MTPSAFVRELFRRNPVLAWTGAAHLVLLGLMLAVAPFDRREVLGLNPWIKPAKFAASIAIYVWTLGWLLHYLAERGRRIGVVSGLTAAAMVVEIALITLQAARGTTSHYNESTPLDATIFRAMGLFITINTGLVLYVLLLFLRGRPPIAPSYLWGIRLGLALFLLATLEGFVMTERLAHAVGVADGGPGLPIVNWSTRGGDLRAAHFVGLHSLQVLPLVGFLLSWREEADKSLVPVLGVFAAAAAYAGVVLLLFRQALSGRPLIPL